MSFQTRRVIDSRIEPHMAVPRPRSVALLFNQVQSARATASELGLKSSEVALRRAVIAMSNELGVPSGLEKSELLFIE